MVYLILLWTPIKSILQKGADKMARQTYGAQELGDLLGVSQSKAYQFIRTMNNELKEKGFLTVRGKVPAAYVQKRFFGVAAAGEEETDNGS